MTTRLENPKLVELRSKTDRQLVELVARKLDLAARLAGDVNFHGPAETACEEARRLLPFLSRPVRRRFEARLCEIGEMLRPSAHAACF